MRVRGGEKLVTKDDDELALKEILEKFPMSYREQDRQEDVLVNYVKWKLKGNKKTVAENADISYPTVNKMEKTWNQLTPRETVILLTYLQGILQNRELQKALQ